MKSPDTTPTLTFDNAAWLEEIYEAWRASPASVSADWARYFERLEVAPAAAIQASPAASDGLSLAVFRLVEAYRAHGHLAARVDPLGEPRPQDARLELASYGLSEKDLDRTIDAGGLFGLRQTPLRQLVDALRETYCSAIGVETLHIQTPERRDWLLSRLESSRNHLALSSAERVQMLERITDAEAFEQFLHTKFLGEKRFSLEGGEGLIPLLDRLIGDSAAAGVEDVVLGMAHRGRLNVLVNVLRKPAGEIFRGFLKLEEDGRKLLGAGDVKYHLGYSSSVRVQGRDVHLSLAFNPSHLEAIYPVLEGRVRARQDRIGDAERRRALPLVLHGDASFAGQGVLAEVINYSGIKGYRTGGTIHVVVNNQVGFTTAPSDSRSSAYATNLARMLDIPILHVNGEDAEAIAQSARLAVEYRQKFQQDVVIDLVCFRKHGHNEGDEPRFTQPVLYRAIDKHPGVRARFAAALAKEGVVSETDAAAMIESRKARLEQELTATKNGGGQHPHEVSELWSRFKGGRDADVPEVKTGLPRATLEPLAKKLVEWPKEFEPHPKLIRGALKDRTAMAAGEKSFDWGTAENLAFASLLTAGHRVRLSGQDAMRGTFTQRHAVYFDHRDNRSFSPLTNLSPTQGRFEVLNSPLSEFGVLGFDYGYSLDAPDALVMWEAQFGDFANGAQVIIDQFLSSAEDKWGRLSGLVMLLPHGFEGQGPEHSSARLERFLSLCAEDNWQVVNLTTPAQYFHALRRQIVRPWRKPLVVMTPKSLLRHPEAVSRFEEFDGTFQRVLGDPTVEASKVRRVLVCSGKVYYDLAKRRAEQKSDDTAIIRLEQFYPYPHAELAAELKKYPRAEKLVWVQEEPWNMGAWYYLRAHDAELRKGGLPMTCVSRAESASPATGHPKAHEYEQQKLLDEAFGDDSKALRAASR